MDSTGGLAGEGTTASRVPVAAAIICGAVCWHSGRPL